MGKYQLKICNSQTHRCVLFQKRFTLYLSKFQPYTKFNSASSQSCFTIVLNRTRMKYSGVLILVTLTFIGASKIKKTSKSVDDTGTSSVSSATAVPALATEYSHCEETLAIYNCDFLREDCEGDRAYDLCEEFQECCGETLPPLPPTSTEISTTSPGN